MRNNGMTVIRWNDGDSIFRKDDAIFRNSVAIFRINVAIFSNMMHTVDVVGAESLE